MTEIYIRDGNLPTGKGQFIWLLPRLVDFFGSVENLVAGLIGYNYQWVMVKAQQGYLLGCSTDYDRERHIDLLDEFVPLAEAAGIEVHGWGYCFGNTSAWRKMTNQQQKEVDRIVEALERWRFRSWTVNAESHWKVSDGYYVANDLMVLLTETLASHVEAIDVPIGLSTYRYPSSHPGFPFNGFLQHCDFSCPQVYWQLSNYPVAQLEKSVREWTEIRDLPFVPAGTTYPEGDWWPTGDHLRAFNARAKEMPEVIGCNYWEYYYPILNIKTDILQALAEFDWPSQNGVPPVDTLDAIIADLDEIMVRLKAVDCSAPIPDTGSEPETESEVPPNPYTGSTETGIWEVIDDKAVPFLNSGNNDSGYPVFDINAGSQYRMERGTTFEAYTETIKADGDKYYVGVFEPEGAAIPMWKLKFIG